MKILAVCIIVVILIIAYSVTMPVWLHGQNVKMAAPSGYLPETVTISRTMSDTARICIEPAQSDLVSCRTVGELRKWVQERKLR